MDTSCTCCSPVAYPAKSDLTELKKSLGDAKDDLEDDFKLLEETFPHKIGEKYPQIRLIHPRDIYPIYNALNRISATIHDLHDDKFTTAWKNILDPLRGRYIYNIGVGEGRFDISIAELILKNGKKEVEESISYKKADVVNDQSTREKVVNYIRQTDLEAFGSCFQKGFLDAILSDKKIVCYTAYEKTSDSIKGIIWGFYSNDDNNSNTFHVWEMSRKANQAFLKIGTKLFEKLKEDEKVKTCSHITLNVDEDNKGAYNFYRKMGFTMIKKDPATDKIFMAYEIGTEGITIEKPSQVTKTFVMKAVFLPKLAFYYLMSKIEQACRYIWFR